MKDYLSIILALFSLLGIIYRIYRVEADIYQSIENVKDTLADRLNSVDSKINIHIAIYSERKEQIDYLIHALDQKIDHKFNRLQDRIKEILK